MSWILSELPWLPAAPADFRKRCREAAAAEADLGLQFATLARHKLDLNELIVLSRAIEKSIADGRDVAPLVSTRVAILANGTTKLWSPALSGSAARHGVAAAVVVGEYDQVLQEAVDPSSKINASNPDVVLLALDYRGLPWEALVPGSEASARDALDRIKAHYTTVREGIVGGSGATLIWQTLASPPEPVFGQSDRRIVGTARWLIQEINAWIVAEAERRGDALLDTAVLAEQVGTDAWFDPVQWNLHKLPFAQRIVPLYADHIGRLLGAMRGRSRKCLVLDLDNTLWGGVIGDDGLEGIRIGQGDGEGEAFLSIQQYAFALRSRGVILAVASKNERENALLPFRQHPDMVLREEHFAAFAANWIDKATNLEEIARSLNIGVDALVLLDDNPAERAHVRAALPMVAVPEVPADPSFFVRALASAGYFESVTLVAEDLQRAEQYAANSQRVSAQAQSRNLGEFLQSLEMVATIEPFNPVGRARISQLINKSNQFNLTSRRYTEPEVAVLETEPGVHTLQARLRDRFGDNGMIGVAVCRRQGATWDIDTWLMSCRVLGRRVEELFLAEIVRAAREQGVATLRGRFIPTGKNDLVRDHYSKLGFTATGTDGKDTLWQLDIGSYDCPDLPIEVHRPPQNPPRT